MTDQTPGMPQPWDTPGSQPSAAPARQPRQQRKPREAKAESAATEPKTRKPREAKPASDTIAVSIKEFAAMRVGEEHSKLFVKIHGLLGEVGKAARGKLLAELTKVLG